MKSKIKNLLQKILPTSLFLNIYTMYAKRTSMGIADEKLKKYASFRKRGFYDFGLDDTYFKIMLDPANGGVDAEIYADGHYESDMLKLIQSHLIEGGVFLDVGANIGQHSLYASHFAAHVYSFEPIQRLYNQFQSSVFENNILNITAYNYALGNKYVSLPIYGSRSNMGGSTIVTSENRNKIQDIKVLRLDDVYIKMGISSCSLIKIDVEGYEYDVLLGAGDFIKRFKPKIIIEYSPVFYRKVDEGIGESIYNFLRDMGYEIYNLDSVLEDKKVRTFDDLKDLDQTNIFCV